MVEFFIPGKPVGKARARTITQRFDKKLGKLVPLPFARTYTPEDTENYTGLVQWYAKQAMERGVMLVGPLRLDYVMFFPVAKSWSKRKQCLAIGGLIRPEVKPDWDNVGKLLSDAMNAVVYADDKQIVCGSFDKRYSEKVGVWVCVQRVAEQVKPAAFTQTNFKLDPPMHLPQGLPLSGPPSVSPAQRALEAASKQGRTPF